MAAFFLRLQDEGCRRVDDDDDPREGGRLGLGRPMLHTTTPVLLSLTHGRGYGAGGGVPVRPGEREGERWSRCTVDWVGSVRLTKRLLLGLEPYGSRGSLILWM